MKYYTLQQKRLGVLWSQAKCIIAFALIVSPIVAAMAFYRPAKPIIFHGCAFCIGWLTWTFTEYMLHRFWTHGKHARKAHQTLTSHLYHHSHPTEISVSASHRIGLAALAALLVSLSILLNNYFTILAGLGFGFTAFIFMHYFLHQKWSAIVFPTLHRNHIYHHCKYPNHCHGISVSWWDRLFKTFPPKDAKISPKIIAFYFGESVTSRNTA